MTIRNLSEVNDAIKPYIASTAQLTDKGLKLERVLSLLKELGDPQEKLRIVHIAGTSGKTSTSYYMAALLGAAGRKVGLTVSPHVDAINERIQINGQPLPEDVFCRELGELLEVVGRAQEKPSYFELLTVMAYWVFARQDVDYAVVETGLGGLHDATNVVKRQDKVCIITDIGFDHMHILGDTLAKIAAQKAGIIQDRNQAFMYKQKAEIMRPIRSRVAKHHARLQTLDEQAERRIWHSALTDLTGYQRRNWLLAYAAYRHLEKRDDLKHLTSKALRQTQSIDMPGRLETKQIKGKTVVMDGAHNPQKMSALIHTFRQLYPGVKPVVLLSLKDNKDQDGLAPLLVSFASRIIVTTFATVQDFPASSMDPEELGASLQGAGAKHVQVIPDQHQAFRAFLEAAGEVCLITGSFYLLSQLRSNERLG